MSGVATGSLRTGLLTGGVIAIVAVASGAFMVAQPDWRHQRDALSPPDLAFTWVALFHFVAGVVVGLARLGRAGWLSTGAGLVVGSVAAAALLGEPKLALPTLLIVEFAPLSLGYVIGQLIVDPGRHRELILACAFGLWIPFAALAALGIVASISSPGLGEGNWTTFLAAVVVVGAIPLGLLAIRSEGTRLLGRIMLMITGWGVGVWALLDGGYGRALWLAEVSPPLIAVMLAGVVVGSLLGLAAVLYGGDPIAPGRAGPAL